MRRYTDREKVAAAADYCRDGCLGLRQVARRHGVDVSSLRLWVAAYRIHGAAGVKTKKRKLYSAKFKLTVLQRMHEQDLSIRQVSALLDIKKSGHDRPLAASLRAGGFAALHPHNGIRKFAMVKQAESPTAKGLEDETRTRQELIDELRQLRMENAYLKNLKALAQADETASVS